MAYIPEPGRRRIKPDGMSFVEAKIVMAAVEKHFEVTTEDLLKTSRKKETVYPRQIAMYLLAHYTVLTFKSIGVIFGKDHTTVIHSIEVVDNYLFCDEQVKEQIANIISTFSNES